MFDCFEPKSLVCRVLFGISAMNVHMRLHHAAIQNAHRAAIMSPMDPDAWVTLFGTIVTGHLSGYRIQHIESAGTWLDTKVLAGHALARYNYLTGKPLKLEEDEKEYLFDNLFGGDDESQALNIAKISLHNLQLHNTKKPVKIVFEMP